MKFEHKEKGSRGCSRSSCFLLILPIRRALSRRRRRGTRITSAISFTVDNEGSWNVSESTDGKCAKELRNCGSLVCLIDLTGEPKFRLSRSFINLLAFVRSSRTDVDEMKVLSGNLNGTRLVRLTVFRTHVGSLHASSWPINPKSSARCSSGRALTALLRSDRPIYSHYANQEQLKKLSQSPRRRFSSEE